MAGSSGKAASKPGLDLKAICDQLLAECEDLLASVKELIDAQWQTATIFYGWTVRDEIMHLLFLDAMGVLALKDAAAFAGEVKKIRAGQAQGIEISQQVRARYKDQSNQDVRKLWETGFRDMCSLFAAQDGKTRMPWFGPDMSVPSFASARQMETWAHGQDIFDLLRIRRTNTDRVKNIAELGVRTFKWSFVNRKLEVPTTTPYVELMAPSGDVWRWNDASAPESVKGMAEDFCLVVTQRRHADDTALKITGEGTRQWMEITQCFAGAPSDGPAPGVRVVAYDA